MSEYDITLLTDARYDNPPVTNAYINNILLEDQILTQALQKRGLNVFRTHWDNPDFDWSSTKMAMFRTTWDYSYRFDEFMNWMEMANQQTRLINPIDQIKWNLDKSYLLDLEAKGIAIPPTMVIQMGDRRSLSDIVEEAGWAEVILKPAVSGAARHTYRLSKNGTHELETTYKALISKEKMMLQPFLTSVLEKGEVSLMVMNGTFTHAILKKAKPGDFRVQDDHGGTVHEYVASNEEKQFAEKVMSVCNPLPVYGRVDIIWGDDGVPVVSELEVIEPELWFRHHPASADQLADGIIKFL